MSRYARGKEPKCPGAGNPWCAGVLKQRGSQVCLGCYKHSIEVPPAPVAEAAEHVAIDRKHSQMSADLTSLRVKYKESLNKIDVLDRELQHVTALHSRDIDPVVIKPSSGGRSTNEATNVFLIGDWHSEEIVNPNTINNKNAHTVEIHQQRQERFWQKALGMHRLIEAGVKVPTIVLALLGDFITNEIHDADSAENNELLPIDAMMMVENELAGGINFLLNHTKSRIVIDTHSGNHARTTHKVRIANEKGHSLEYYAYSHLAKLFVNEPRVTFRVNEGYHSFMDIYDVRVRLHHGHAVKYGGGVGGLTIPVNKAIAQWNKEMVGERAPDLDVFGHFHQAFDGSNFVCNGSMIGYNAFAKWIKASYEPPKQVMLVIDKSHGRTFTVPIYVQPKESV